MAYFYTERGRRLFVRLMFGLACWFMVGVAVAAVRSGCRHAVDTRRLAVELVSAPGWARAELPSGQAVTLLRACAVRTN